MTREEKIREIEAATTASVWKRPDSIIVERPDWFQITTPSSKQFWFNGVARSILNEKEAEARVAETVAHYRKLGTKFRWFVGPSATPARLGSLLESHGMTFGHVGLGMAAEVDKLVVARDPRITIERVDPANVDDYVAASAAGWSTPPAAAEEIRADMNRSVRDASHPTIYFLARYDGRPAASGALLPLKRSGYLLASSVAPEFRGKGVYRQLVGHRAEVMRAMGLKLATIQAMSTTSAPICAKMGFETFYEMRMYVS